LNHSFYVRVKIEPDTPDDGVWPTRAETHARLAKALAHSTAREALSDALMATVETTLFEEPENREALLAQARHEYASDETDDIQIDDDAAISECDGHSYDWVMAWVSVMKQD
jgi:hypothetical protein